MITADVLTADQNILNSRPSLDSRYRQDQRGNRQRHRRNYVHGDERYHRALLAVGVSEVSDGYTLKPVYVLYDERLVQAQLSSQSLDESDIVSALPENRRHRVAWDKADHEEDKDRDPQQ
jgi:hypothetical protein